MEVYEKRGYLDQEFLLFHLTDIPNREFEFHYHEFDKIVLFLKGNVDYIIEGKTYRLQPYDIVLVSRHEIHRPCIDTSAIYERIILYLSPGFLNAYKTEEYDLEDCIREARLQHSHVLRLRSPEKSALLHAAAGLEKAWYGNGYANPLRCRILFLEFMIQLNRAARSRNLQYMQNSQGNQKILELIGYINDNLTADLSVDSLSRHCYLSRYHMMRLFREETGRTIGSYINDKRLLLARELLAGADLPITRICYDCGFHSYSTFSRAYKKMFAETPQATRRRQGGPL